LPRRKKEETSALQTAALFCIIIGGAMIATTYSGILELFQGYLGGIILLAVGATLFAYEKAPEETVHVYRSLLGFLKYIIKSLFELVKSVLKRE